MSHFITLIVVPEAVFESGEEEIHNYIALRMSPYDESIAVAPHNRNGLYICNMFAKIVPDTTRRNPK